MKSGGFSRQSGQYQFVACALPCGDPTSQGLDAGVSGALQYVGAINRPYASSAVQNNPSRRIQLISTLFELTEGNMYSTTDVARSPLVGLSNVYQEWLVFIELDFEHYPEVFGRDLHGTFSDFFVPVSIRRDSLGAVLGSRFLPQSFEVLVFGHAVARPLGPFHKTTGRTDDGSRLTQAPTQDAANHEIKRSWNRSRRWFLRWGC